MLLGSSKPNSLMKARQLLAPPSDIPQRRKNNISMVPGMFCTISEAPASPKLLSSKKRPSKRVSQGNTSASSQAPLELMLQLSNESRDKLAGKVRANAAAPSSPRSMFPLRSSFSRRTSFGSTSARQCAACDPNEHSLRSRTLRVAGSVGAMAPAPSSPILALLTSNTSSPAARGSAVARPMACSGPQAESLTANAGGGKVSSVVIWYIPSSFAHGCEAVVDVESDLDGGEATMASSCSCNVVMTS
mmetsp:Transcript_120862/g.240774  ORF Transcript_120862/g.240774 Transcript_120862/m.240774 type:complete len:246 (-) Transcript_120862:410-1147(-)